MSAENRAVCPVDHTNRKLVGKRVNIGLAAKKYKAEGVIAEVVDPLDQTYKFQSPEALEKWYSLKPELYALTAVMIDRIVGRALKAKEEDKYPPFGLIRLDEGAWSIDKTPTPIASIGNILNPLDLQNKMSAVLGRAKREEIDTLEYPEEHPDIDTEAVSVYNRLKSLIEFKRKYVVKDKEPEAIERFIQGGIGTASLVMSQMIDMIPKVYKKQGLNQDSAEMAQTAKNSFQPVAELAMKHLYEFGEISDNLEEGEFFKRYKADSFTLIDTTEGKRLKTVEDAFDYNRDALAKYHPLNFSGSDIAGCPAMVNFGDGSAARKLWNWHVELAGEIYEEQKKEREKAVELGKILQMRSQEILKRKRKESKTPPLFSEQAPRLEQLKTGQQENPRYILSMHYEGKRYIFDDNGFKIYYEDENGAFVCRTMDTEEIHSFLGRVADGGPHENHEQYIPMFVKAKALAENK